MEVPLHMRKNGGAAFIVIYLLCLLGLGLPILICEYAIGRGSNKSLGSAFKALSPERTRWHHSDGQLMRVIIF